MGMSVIPFSFSEEIPDWVKHTAQWWADRKISQSDFTNALESLIKDGVIHIPPTELAPPGPDKTIPDWVRNTAGWWANDYIPDSDFINAVQYLVSIGLIEVKVATPEPVEEIVEPKVINEKLIHIVLDGYDYAYQEENFALDIEVFEEEKFFATHGRAEIPVENVNLDISLYNEENQLIHSFSGVAKDGKYRYDVVAKETSQERGLWLINNLYTVEVIATSGDNTAKKSYEFLGRESSAYDKGSATTSTSTTWEEQVTKTVEINPATTNGPTLILGDNFGASVVDIGDLNSDGVNDLAVGAHGDDMDESGNIAGGTNRGAVHIFYMNTDGSVDSTVEINDSTANGPTLANGDFFGESVANIGDLNSDGVNDLVVGAYKDGANARGAVHIMFMNTDGSVDSTVEINDSTANGPTLRNSDKFGISVANIGDLNGDGVNDLAVGAESDDMDESGNAAGGTNRGAVHIMFMNTDGSVDSTVEINSSTANGPTLADSDWFGRSVANIGDLDGDGVNDLAVGASGDNMDANGDDDGGANRGAVHIIHMSTDGSVKSVVEINDFTTNGPAPSNQDFLGRSVANIGDLDGNGINDLAVGASGDDGGDGIGNNSGAVHIIFLE